VGGTAKKHDWRATGATHNFCVPFKPETAMAVPNGQFIWHDLITSDIEAAARFYCDVVDWETQKSKGPMDYTMIANEGIPIGGFVQIDSGGMGGGPPHWLPYVGVEDVDQTIALATALGGKVVSGPADIPQSGRYAIIEDPEGTSIAIYRSASSTSSSELDPVPGEFSWHELYATDHKAAFDFYSRIFGWERTSEFDMGEMGIYQMYGKNGKVYGGMMNAPQGTPTGWMSYAMVDDVKPASERLKSGGGQIINGPMEVPGGDWIVMAVDPQGASFALHAKKTAA
jgi:predicted enzyme related to lactoylglutathione lyase